MITRLRSLLTFIIGWPLSIISLFFIFRLMSPHTGSLKDELQTIDVAMASLGFVCFSVYYFLRSYIYVIILRFLKYPLTLRETAFHWSQSETHRYIPGNIWSFVGRSMSFSRKNVDKKDIATSLIVENQLVLIGTCLLTVIGIPLLVSSFASNVPLNEYFLPLGVICGVVLTGVYVYSRSLSVFLKYSFIKKVLTTPFGVKENLTLVGISSLSYFFFGLGYFFIMSSLFPLHPQNVWELVGFFVFSLLVGYISFITPTGLGIREGVLILGLSSIAPTTVVGLAAILTRFILIASEIFYLLLCLLWYKTKYAFVANIEPFFAANKHIILLSSAILAYILYFTVVSFLRYDHFYTGRFDLGNMAQTVWNTYHGNFFQLTDPNGSAQVSRLAFHADFILIALSPLYAIWENPKMLLLIQAVITGLGAIFVYLLGQKIIKGRTLPLLIAFVFLLNPSLQRANIYDFHAVVLATTFLLGAFYFLTIKRLLLAAVFLFIACITKEQVWLIAAFFGLYSMLFLHYKRYGLSLFIIGSGMFVYLIFQAIPNALGDQHFALTFYKEYGEGPGDIIKNILFSPHKTLPLLFEQDRLYFYQQLLGPVGFLSLLSPLYFLFASGDGVIDLLSSNHQFRQIYYQYTATLTPFIFISLIFGVRWLLRSFPSIPRWAVACYLAIMAIYGTYSYGPLPGAKEPNLAMFTEQRSNAKELAEYLNKLPLEYSVAGTNNVGSHLSHRKTIYAFPKEAKRADVVVMLTDGPHKPFNEKQSELIQDLKSNQQYIIFREDPDFIVFKKMSHADTYK